MAVQLRVFEGTAEVQRQAAEAARSLGDKERVTISGDEGSESAMELYQFGWSTVHDGLVEQVLKDYSTELVPSGRKVELVVQKRIVSLTHGSLFTPEHKLSIIIPLPPATGRVLFHTKTEGTEVGWSVQSCYELQADVAIRPLQPTLTFMLLLFSDGPCAETTELETASTTQSS